jgi:probable rRNA maturation factor
MKIDFTNQSSEECDHERLIDLARYSLKGLGIHPESELSITLVDVAEMSELNSRWMGESGPTDVLSFPMDELKPNSEASGPGVIGDIVICPSYAGKQAELLGRSLHSELELLTVHGVLHLLGFDHREIEEERAMFARQADLLEGWRGK